MEIGTNLYEARKGNRLINSGTVRLSNVKDRNELETGKSL